ncbi:phosphatidylinositol transfer protein SEC14 [Culex quinquefasciatus]|uniref:Phosphatidylinositol transfer protein SEC14 n=1 Tax=Culex quinquefasciatus TaxID=7176 RepID=B0XFC4_CULQU|nr:phosphatidylinositol transfer protein SEC14 [Culex quinquefasciatus]|eukprot:XP_001868346.1 phosphatidylinositol transfer protein SEC14 [Culex quinquefasciatus]
MCDAGSLYEFPGLPDCLDRIARAELCEDDQLRKQSLEQMREWIAKNPRIKNCRTDDAFLLRFLRTKKFSVVRACETLQKYLTMRQTYPKWCRKLDPQDPEISALLDYCALVPVGRDSSGRIVVMGVVRNFDASRHGSDDMIRLNMLVTEALLDDEANQIAGFTHVFDNSAMTMAHVTCWTLENIGGYLRSIANGVPIRLKQNHFVNVPGFAAQVSKYCLSYASEKLKSRIFCHRSIDELRKNIEPSVLPEEYGGTVPLAKLNENFKKYLLTKRDMLLALDRMEIVLGGGSSTDQTHSGKDIVDAGAVGSFRKLQID